jgi:hypothetical protein
MVLLVGHAADAVHEAEGAGEVGKAVLALEVVLADDAPARAELPVERLELGAPERRRSAPARDALLRRQLAHDGLPTRSAASRTTFAAGPVLATQSWCTARVAPTWSRRRDASSLP